MANDALLQESPDFSLVVGGPLYQMLRRARSRSSAAVPASSSYPACALLLGAPGIAEIALVVFVYTIGMWIWRHQSAVDVESWYASTQNGQMHLTMAGDWFASVSVPVFQFILLRWYMRILIWFWCLFRVSHLKLRLLAAHPDRAGGLGFLARSSLAFGPLLFAQSALLSGQIASRIFYKGQSLLSFKLMILGFVVLFIVVPVDPLFLFTLHLTTDELFQLLVVTVAPFIPLLLTIMPLDQLLTEVFKVVF
jgi:hypothetical protein